MDRLLKIGEVQPINSRDIKDSRMGLGMEKLDRDAFDPEKVYDRVAALGVKWIRIQSGWQKTEKCEGVYDFAWLDRQVDELLARGLKPWLCLCYGNVVYDALAKKYYGAVGCTPIRTERAYAAWLKYAEETAKHFAGRIEYYEIWNEPEGDWTWRPQANAKEYAEFAIKTAEAVKRGDVSAKVITGSHYQDSMEFFNTEFASGTLAVSDAVSYHSYHYDETYSMQRVAALKALIKHYNCHAEIIQGESGSQSRNGGNGALCWIRTNQNMQTKQILRHTVADILSGVKFTSIFSCVDMAENLDAEAGKPITTCGYFGLLGAEFDSQTGSLVGDYYEKPSYYAFQNLCAIFNESVTPIDIPVIIKPQNTSRIEGGECHAREMIYGGIEKENGARAFVYWRSTNLITCQDYASKVTLELSCVTGEVRLIDPMDGSIYKIPEDMMTRDEYGRASFLHLPIKDYPLFIVFGDF